MFIAVANDAAIKMLVVFMGNGERWRTWVPSYLAAHSPEGVAHTLVSTRLQERRPCSLSSKRSSPP
jgi:AAA+ superfamily predicted ATPase